MHRSTIGGWRTVPSLARERAEAITERDEALAARDAALGVTALNPPPQRTSPAGRAHRPLQRGRR